MYLIKKMGWLILETLLFIVIFIALVVIQYYFMKFLGSTMSIWNVEKLDESTSPFTLIPSFLPVLIAFTGAAVLTYHFIMKHPFPDLGFAGRDAFILAGKGFLLSAVLIIPGFLIMVISGQVKLLPISFNPAYFIGFLIFFFIQSSAEEVFTRAYLIPTFEGKLGTWIAIIVSSSLFGIMHVGNDNFTWIGFFNIVLGGWLMALLFIYYRNIWICAGFHTGWNFIQATLFDFNVSGVDVYSLIQFQDIGYANITGSHFGYEGSLISIIALILALILMYKKMNFVFKPLVWKAPVSNESNEDQFMGDSTAIETGNGKNKSEQESI